MNISVTWRKISVVIFIDVFIPIVVVSYIPIWHAVNIMSQEQQEVGVR